MKFLLQLFADQDTDSTSRAFSQAWIKLVFLYLVIIAVVIGVFASLVVLQVNEKIDSQRLRPDSQIVLNANEALEIAQDLKPRHGIEGTRYSLEDNTLLFKVAFDDTEDVEIDLLTGRAQIGDEEHDTSLFELLTDNVVKIIWWIGGGVFLLASIGSFLIARFTLRPISISTKKQKRFISDAAHELRNPLASLQMTLESFLRTPQKTLEFTHSVAEDMLHEVKRLVSTSEALLKLEEVERRTKNISATPVREVLEEVVKSLHSDLDSKEIKVIEKVSDVPMYIDPSDLTTVLYNLLHNAIKFSKPNAEIVVVWNGRVLQVTDSGIGIEKKYISHIFERFHKADPSRYSETNSSGLGLALVDDIVASYKASISVTSEVNKGTTFTIEF